MDQGYDISDYYKIAEEFGTMEEFDELLAEAKKRHMYVLMDLVINHCSDRHEWFQKALADPYGKYAGYFHFVKGRDGQSAQQLPFLFRRQCMGAGAGDRHVLSSYVCQRAARSELGESGAQRGNL